MSLDITNSTLHNNRINKQPSLKKIHVIVINTGEPTVDQLLVYPTKEQKNILHNCLTPTDTFQAPINHTTHSNNSRYYNRTQTANRR
ncbi:hypothetical protein CEXT_703531 [Caerostris extrusa]|uniref:Uncharacterized protein n=1 Tax=Caerostris extrusa TaxID=172846 RepID=A0AAV4SLM6_CAEEX|nr:hypothetical protein CEXT_703531 [Caerostris extrusa]